MNGGVVCDWHTPPFIDLVENEICHPIVLGNPQTIERVASEAGVSTQGMELIDPYSSEQYANFAEKYLQMRHRKGVTPRGARNDMSDRVRFGMMLVKEEAADGLVCVLYSYVL